MSKLQGKYEIAWRQMSMRSQFPRFPGAEQWGKGKHDTEICFFSVYRRN